SAAGRRSGANPSSKTTETQRPSPVASRHPLPVGEGGPKGRVRVFVPLWFIPTISGKQRFQDSTCRQSSENRTFVASLSDNSASRTTNCCHHRCTFFRRSKASASLGG